MDLIYLEIIIILFLIVLNGIFALSEIAIITSRKIKLQKMSQKGNKNADIAIELSESPNQFLSTIQIGITLIGILAGAFGGATIAQTISTNLEGVALLQPYSEALGFLIVVVIITYLSLVVGELVPKRIALNNPERIAVKIAKPMMIVANKADLPHAEENIQRLKEKYDNVVPASAEAELALSRAAEAELIKYTSGEDDFEILQADKLSPQQLKALEYIRENVLQEYGGTGVQEALNQAIFNLLDMIVVYPVEDEHKLSDQKGNVLPDALLIPRGSKPRDMAFLIHTDIGEGFMHAIDARSCRRVSSDHELQDGDIISIITR